MKLIVSKGNLLRGVNIVSKAVPTRTTMAILECILIDASTNEIKLMANDMELGIETRIEGVVEERGVIALDAKIFSEIVRKLPDSDVTIETDASFKTIISCEKSKFNIVGKSGDDFSYIPYIEKNESIVISQFTLKEVIQQTIFSIADDEVLSYIANNIKSNVRELEGALNKLLAYNNLVHIPITMEIAEKELSNIITPDKPREITPQLIIEVVSEHFHISVDQMISKTRSSDVAKPRQIAMYLCKNMTDSPLDTIGSLLGGRDHSTIIHGIKKVTEEYDTNETTRTLIETIKKKINPN